MADDGRVTELREILTELEAILERVGESENRVLSVAAAPLEEPLDEVEPDGAEVLALSPAQLNEMPIAGASKVVALDAGDAKKQVSEYATLEALQFAFRDCMACKLGQGRNRLVFGTGASRPRLLFIGEGPGAEEDAQGLPFVGRAGALLTGFITALGLTRGDVYITNVVKCRPPGNRTPEPDEVASCRAILQRQIELLDPKLIVTLGNVPLKALNPQAAGITKERGRNFAFLRWTVLPTFHPSYLLRNPRDIQICWADFRSAFREVYSDR
jgi:DNA polymerase